MSLKVQNLVLGYDEKMILKSVDLEILKGKITVLIGPNGCGKSTLLKGMSRLLKPKSGGVVLDNQSIHEMPPKALAKQLGILPQTPLAPEGTTVKELCFFGRHPYQQWFKSRTEHDEKVVEWALEVTGVKPFEDYFLEELSGGQRQRAFIAMALAQETDILLLDEPTTYLDLSYQLEILKLLKTLNETTGLTIVMVLHELNQAARFADYLVCMKEGQIVYKGEVEEIFNETMLNNVFGLNCLVMSDPTCDRPMCIARS
ncbi:MAG TPA: Fe(3+)-dicitrate ABC transporter ATP-binding protein [Firmicutes bacterium]|nr:Fe(3+)-dicitrate ABC transporter ATP-binding protein [Bacillota bacterium]